MLPRIVYELQLLYLCYGLSQVENMYYHVMQL